jgi:hypothetical protein
MKAVPSPSESMFPSTPDENVTAEEAASPGKTPPPLLPPPPQLIENKAINAIDSPE